MRWFKRVLEVELQVIRSARGWYVYAQLRVVRRYTGQLFENLFENYRERSYHVQL